MESAGKLIASLGRTFPGQEFSDSIRLGASFIVG